MAKEVSVRVDAGKWTGTLGHTWNYIGYDECNFTHSPGGMALIEKFGRLEKPYYIRAHHMLCTGNLHGFYKWGSTNAYTEDENGDPAYNFDTVDKMIGIWLRGNCKPFFELGFMPRDLADPRDAKNGKNYEIGGHMSEYQRVGWAMPPGDYQKWHDLIFALVSHCVSRCGEEEVASWYWEMWNEPDIFYWRGTREEFFKLYDYTEAAIHKALPAARFGGPATCGETDPEGRASLFLRAFLAHVRDGVNYVTGAKGTRIDFTSFHTKGGGYGFDPLARKQLPSVRAFVENVRTQAAILREYGCGGLECVLSEADPDGWAAGGRFDNCNLNFRNTEYYASYVACAYKNLYDLAGGLGMDIRPLAWAFMFEGERCFEGTRAFSTQGIDKAVFNLFKLFARLGTQRVALECGRDADICGSGDLRGNEKIPEVDGWATVTGEGAVQVLLYCHHDDWDVAESFDVRLAIENLPFEGMALIRHCRIDGSHSNAYAEWVRQGRPDYPNPGQYAAIKAREGVEYCEAPARELVHARRIERRFSLPVHGISFLTVEKT